MIGHITYLSAKSVSDKFGRRLQFADDIRYTVTDAEFAVDIRGDAGGKSVDLHWNLKPAKANATCASVKKYASGSHFMRMDTLLLAHSSAKHKEIALFPLPKPSLLCT
jgi:homoserine O-acetyltransferase